MISFPDDILIHLSLWDKHCQKVKKNKVHFFFNDWSFSFYASISLFPIFIKESGETRFGRPRRIELGLINQTNLFLKLSLGSWKLEKLYLFSFQTQSKSYKYSKKEETSTSRIDLHYRLDELFLFALATATFTSTPRTFWRLRGKKRGYQRLLQMISNV